MKQTSKFDIGIDYRMASHTGIGTYLRGLVGGMRRNEQPAFSRTALFKSGGIPSDKKYAQMFFEAPIYSVKEQFLYPGLLGTCRLWHAPHYNIPFFKGKSKLVTTVHDIIHWKYRHRLSFIQRAYAKTMLTRAVQISDHLITVSQHTKNDLVDFFSANPEKISVIYNGVDSDFYPVPAEELLGLAEPLRIKYQLPGSFFLYVGMLKPHKNVLRLLRNYLQLRSENKIQSGLVVIGQGGAESEEMKLLQGSQKEITYLPRIEQGELPLFYNLARALVHPSLYEGFGLTVLESLACGTPVITTRRASLPEVGGEAAHYIDGENDLELADTLIRFDRDPEMKQRSFDRCIRQACKFSWDKAARETAQIYEKVLNS